MNNDRVVRELADIRDKWQHGYVVVPVESRIVGELFILPNFMRHCSEVIQQLMLLPTDRLTNNYTYGDLFRTWYTGLTSNPLFNFGDLLVQLVKEADWGLSAHHPWQCNDRWVVIDAFAGQMQFPTKVPLEHSWAQLLQVVPQRNQNFAGAFHKWWDDASQWQRKVLGELLGAVPIMVDRAKVAGQITVTVGEVPKPLIGQTQEVAVQRGENYEDLRRTTLSANSLQLPSPLSTAWLQKVSAQLKSAYQARRTCPWSLEDRQNLQLLLDWIDAKGIDKPPQPPVDKLRSRAPLGPLRRLAEKKPFSIPWNVQAGLGGVVLDEVLEAWNALLLLVRTRHRRMGYEPQLANWDRMIEDLFCHPLMGDFSFREWIDS